MTPALRISRVVVDVVQEAVQRLDALHEALGERVPFRLRDDARDGVEGDQPLGAGLVAVHREGDADAVEQQVGLAPLLADAARRRGLEPLGEGAVVLAQHPFRVAHLVVVRHAHGDKIPERRATHAPR